jgi:hypothetical protein
MHRGSSRLRPRLYGLHPAAPHTLQAAALLVGAGLLGGVLAGCSDSTTGTPNPPAVTCSDTPATICTFAGTGEAAYDGDGHTLLQSKFYWPIDLTYTPSGEWYFLDWNNHRVRHLTPQGTLQTVIGTDILGDGPEPPNDRAEFTLPGWPGTQVNLNHPTHLCPLPDGTLMLTAWHNHKLRHYDPATGLVSIACGDGVGFRGDGGPASSALLNQPTQTIVGPGNALYVLDMRNQRVRKIATDNTISTVVGNGTRGFQGDGGPPAQAELNMPYGTNPPPGGALAFDAQGRLYISDTLNNRIRRVDFALNRIETFAGTGDSLYTGDAIAATSATLHHPRDLVVYQDKLYIADELNHRVRVVDIATGIINTVAGNGQPGGEGDGGPATQASLDQPAGLEIDGQGHLYIADTYNHRFRRVNL